MESCRRREGRRRGVVAGRRPVCRVAGVAWSSPYHHRRPAPTVTAAIPLCRGWYWNKRRLVEKPDLVSRCCFPSSPARPRHGHLQVTPTAPANTSSSVRTHRLPPSPARTRSARLRSRGRCWELPLPRGSPDGGRRLAAGCARATERARPRCVALCSRGGAILIFGRVLLVWDDQGQSTRGRRCCRRSRRQRAIRVSRWRSISRVRPSTTASSSRPW